ncbi:zinc-ribbon domain-containing protein [Bacillus sp. 31A1R]|uniref:Zinc-ribbon domain-containing protein n=1 Tax=Robertmurraya mangrovi TaxID=3098077 RepID=A0ABU5IY41_9BACI|nr:zinc-ribbon domain-containing protein [Bacillus sp. 31A1R]MDZ5472036.1 zinc-ribbon domain-containing protein [Bacillus sp. 31A1R]
MAFCKNCGQKIISQQPFCSNCGTKIELKEIAVTREGETKVTRANNNPKLSKKMIVSVLMLVILAIILVISHLVLSSIYNADKIIYKFETAVKDGDIQTVQKLLKDGGTSVDLSDKSVEAFIDYLTVNDLDEINKGLQKELRKANNSRETDPIVDQYGNSILEIKKGEKRFFLYQQYTIKAVPFKIKVASPFDNVEVQINEEKLKKLNNAEEYQVVGNLLPGAHLVEGIYKGEYVTLKAEETIDASNASGNIIEVYLPIEGEYIALYSNREDAVLFVNGKSTGKTVSELSSFGPISTDGSIKLHAEANGQNGMLKSEVIEITDSYEVYLWFEEEEFEEEQTVNYSESELENFMYDYLSTSVYSINEGDFSIVEHFHDPNGKTYDESKDYLDYLVSKGITEQLLSANLLSYEETDDGYRVKMNEEYEIYYNDGTGKYKEFKSVYQLTLVGNSLMMYKLESTEELNSQDL